MKLIVGSGGSPFVRKVDIGLHELGISDDIERLPMVASPTQPNSELVAINPLGKLPTLILDNGDILNGSAVILEFFDDFQGNNKLIPSKGTERWEALSLQGLSDGMMEAQVIHYYEKERRPIDKQWKDWADGQMGKIDRVLVYLENRTESFADKLNVGNISLACALGFLNLRFAEKQWSKDYPSLANWFVEFSKRQSMVVTAPK
jgi:glutathione S-transferase